METVLKQKFLNNFFDKIYKLNIFILIIFYHKIYTVGSGRDK